MGEGYEGIARQISVQLSERLPSILNQLLETGYNPDDQELKIQCHLTAPGRARNHENHVEVASVNLGDVTPLTRPTTPRNVRPTDASPSNPRDNGGSDNAPVMLKRRFDQQIRPAHSNPTLNAAPNEGRPNKRRRSAARRDFSNQLVARKETSNGKIQHEKRALYNQAPSSLQKLISGVWDSIFAGTKMDPVEIMNQWQAIETSGQPKLLTNNDQDVGAPKGLGAFGRMNVLTRKISQTTKVARSLEVVVQAHWIQCFEDRVTELSEDLSGDKAKKNAIVEACAAFDWTEKELRNKMAIWKGYSDIKNAAGWAALVFAGQGLYRFCKYRVSFTDEAFAALANLRHRFEVAADTLHPRWRMLLGIVGLSTKPKYAGHPHDWVVNGSNNDGIPLRQTYQQWDNSFSYEHLSSSVVDDEAWGDYDPRAVTSETDSSASKCQSCGKQQSNKPAENECACFPNLYGTSKGGVAPVQVFRTPNGKNNGLIACCLFEKGWAVGEFVGEITAGIKGLDVMIDRTERATYQIWQGRKGNHTRFVNHSCEPNAHYERFVWLGKQRTVLVSDGIDADEEVTVDYGPVYWEALEKLCLCGAPSCRYRRRRVQQVENSENG